MAGRISSSMTGWGSGGREPAIRPSLPADAEGRVASFTDLAATAIANAKVRAELTASRARVVASADEARRRLERDLHDGIQQPQRPGRGAWREDLGGEPFRRRDNSPGTAVIHDEDSMRHSNTVTSHALRRMAANRKPGIRVACAAVVGMASLAPSSV